MPPECSDRDQLIMACGTGKTYTSLCIVEEVAMGGHVLFLVPSLALLAQTLRAWTAYRKAYPSCHSKAAARSSSSRLLKRPEVKAAVAWEFAKFVKTYGIHRFFPWTAIEVWDTLHRLGSERARWAPWDIQQRWVIASLQAKEKPHCLD